MKQKNTPLLNLWILFGLQVLILITLLIAFAWFQPHLSSVASSIQRSVDKLPTVRQRINDEQNPEILQKEALMLLDGTASQAKNVQEMIMAPIKILSAFCLILSISTLWLGICAYRLQYQGQKVKLDSPA